MKKDNQSANSLGQFEFSVENMGSIRAGKFTQKPLTVFCGPNNSGKTWVMYALHFFYANAKLERRHIEKNRERIFQSIRKEQTQASIEKIEKELTKLAKLMVDDFDKHLHLLFADYFNLPDELFKAPRFKCNPSLEKWITEYSYPYVFLMPAERNGLHLFYRELSARRTALLHHASKANIDIHELLRDVMRSRYAQPIADYIDWLNGLTEQRKEAVNLHEEALFLQKKLAQGRYNLNRKTGDITYKPYQQRKGVPVKNLGLHATSSTVKSLFGLWFYLEHQAKAGDILMIDEPELNLHLGNQLLIARLLARLVNAGIQVVISTHSDYIVREFNNLILLSEDTSGVLKKQHKYQSQEILQPDQVASYLFDNQTITPFTYTAGEGFAISTFDTTIEEQNKISHEIYHGLQEQDEDVDE